MAHSGTAHLYSSLFFMNDSNGLRHFKLFTHTRVRQGETPHAERYRDKCTLQEAYSY